MKKYILKSFFKILDTLKFKYYQEKIELFIYMKEIALFKEDIKNLLRKLLVQYYLMKYVKIYLQKR